MSTNYQLSKDEQLLADDSEKYIKDSKKVLIEKFASLEQYPSVSSPTTIFMAGSPGAGKTEYATSIIEGLVNDYKFDPIVHIDADLIRDVLPGYIGDNSYVFQKTITVGVDKIHDSVLKNSQSFIMDSTFSNYTIAHKNIERSVSRERLVHIFYLYQNPFLAWEFTKKRNQKEGRYVPKEFFIDAFFTSRDNVEKVKQEFGKYVTLMLVEKDFSNKVQKLYINKENVVNYVNNPYTRQVLEEKLCV
ncbi:TPA: hypothetical protein DEP93_00015 [candidate division WWE3 bacterium]|uniref:Zeta toxin domain-containing protein n=1 Tax=candidate division WWE3 bacterium TaxID=2053526 RepID=A0A3D0ZP12_UNCKA|nr:MAG: hypothetical protein A2245_00800 [candidate division WWE3 bacterium RIFOXYA2_FULL_43_12]OGC75970.1 MAG: hypothetical protein A2547_03940 [candidate division WWE3 bacterium RIFOXYD2_FULL_43_10]HCC41846.1 hypothetical protein [candidate division WWE3 bacterium]